MPNLTLGSQLEYARQRLADGDVRRAAQVCRRILEAFPRCVEAYVLLGEAWLCLGQPERARELFGRAWDACPENQTAARGLFLAGESQTASAPALGRTELARLWIRQGLVAHAVREMRALLAETPRRYDAQTALVEALWRVGAEQEAAQLCQEILASHPNCLTALLIAGAHWLHTERDAEARACLLAAQALDPENGVAQRLLGARSPLPPRTRRLPFREEDAPRFDLPYGDDEDDLADADL